MRRLHERTWTLDNRGVKVKRLRADRIPRGQAARKESVPLRRENAFLWHFLQPARQSGVGRTGTQYANPCEDSSLCRHSPCRAVHRPEPRAASSACGSLSRKATEIALKGFGLVEIAVGVVDAGVGRVDDLIATSRTEVRQAAETITTIGATGAGEQPRAQRAERAPGDESGAAHRANAAGAGSGAGCGGERRATR